jgi:hypothetical protein
MGRSKKSQGIDRATSRPTAVPGRWAKHLRTRHRAGGRRVAGLHWLDDGKHDLHGHVRQGAPAANALVTFKQGPLVQRTALRLRRRLTGGRPYEVVTATGSVSMAE